MKKKSARKAAAAFGRKVSDIEDFLKSSGAGLLSDAHLTWVHDYAIIKLYSEFENLVLHCLVAAINNDTSQLSSKTSIQFPKHLTDEVCTYLIVGDGYFDFRGRDGLIKRLKEFLPTGHYLLTIVEKTAYKDTIEQIVALRNFAAHGSKVAKARALKAVDATRLSSSGAWLKTHGRFGLIAQSLRRFADEIADSAPY